MKPKKWARDRKPWAREQYRRGMFIIPSFFTVSNIFCGFTSVSSSIKGNYELAGLLIGIAMVLDTLDGRIARMTKTTSEFGLQLDSLADVITFGMAPAVLCYQWAFYQFEHQAVDRAGWLACFLFVVCAASRLARFNVQTSGAHDKRYFVGMPTPAAAGMVASAIYCFPERIGGDIAPIVALWLMLLLAFLMVSRVKYRTFKDLNLREPRSYRITVLMALVIIAMAMDLKRALISLASIYVLSGLVGFVFGRRRAKHIEHTEHVEHAEAPPPDPASVTPH